MTNPTRLTLSLIVFCGLIGSGCSKEAEPSAPPSTPAPQANTSALAALKAGASAPTTSALGATAASGPTPSVPAAAEAGFLDPQDLKSPALELMQKAADAYHENQHLDAGEQGGSWPDLTDFSLLVKHRILAKLPPAPVGKKFVLDPKTKKVALENL